MDGDAQEDHCGVGAAGFGRMERGPRRDGLAPDRKGEEIHHFAEARQDLAACGYMAVQRLQCAMAADH